MVRGCLIDEGIANTHIREFESAEDRIGQERKVVSGGLLSCFKAAVVVRKVNGGGANG